jgi:DCC1-like thiol-disulfide oxidoreductase
VQFDQQTGGESKQAGRLTEEFPARLSGPDRQQRQAAEGILVASWHFKVLYDGECPFCRLEARWLSFLNRSGHLALEDIAAPGFDPSHYGSTLPELMGSLHGVFPDGRKTLGMETFRQAYHAVGLGSRPDGLAGVADLDGLSLCQVRPASGATGAGLRADV